MQRDYAQNILCGFAHLGGYSVGIVANQPAVLAGVLDINASIKAARFIRFCDAFNIPLVTFEDVPGFLPGVGAGARRHHQARREAALRVLRGDRAQAHRHHAQGVRRRVRRHDRRKHIRGDFNVAWPTAEIAVMGPKGAVEILFRKEITESDDPRGATDAKVAEYREKFAQPVHRRRTRLLDDIIDPRDTRPRLIDALETLRDEARPESAEEARRTFRCGRRVS